MQTGSKVLVYVQAIPKAVPQAVKTFPDLSRARFVMTQSSKTALARSKAIFPDAEIIAAGYNAVLQEALVRGAERAISLPLFDDPLDQAKSFPVEGYYSRIIVGENPDGPFTGASLCGALAALRKMNFELIDDHADMRTVRKEGILLVRADEGVSHNVDIRRIADSMRQKIQPSETSGGSSLVRREQDSKPEMIISGSLEEISSAFSRRLRRLTTR